MSDSDDELQGSSSLSKELINSSIPKVGEQQQQSSASSAVDLSSLKKTGPTKPAKTNFPLRGFDPTSDLKLPTLSSRKTADYIKWAQDTVRKLKLAGIDRYVRLSPDDCFEDAKQWDDGNHTDKEVRTVFLLIHAKIAAALEIATVGQLGVPFFDQIQRCQDEEDRKFKLKHRTDKAFIEGNAHTLWRTIEAKLNRRSTGDINHYLTQIQQLSYKVGTDPMDLRKRFDELKSELQALGFNGLNSQWCKYLWLQYIPKELESLKQNLDSAKDFTDDDIYEMLCTNYTRYLHEKGPGKQASKPGAPGQHTNTLEETEETPGEPTEGKRRRRRRSKDTKPDDSVNALSSSSSASNGTGDPSNKTDLKCTHCGKFKHTAEQCSIRLNELVKELQGKLKAAGVENMQMLLECYPQEDYASEDDASEPEEYTEPEEQAMSLGPAVNKRKWLIDGGAHHTGTAYRDVFTEITRLKNAIELGTANKGVVKGTHIGEVRMTETKSLRNVLYIPQLRQNIISENKFLDNNFYVYKTKSYFYLLRRPLEFNPQDVALKIERDRDTGMFYWTREVDQKGRPLQERKEDFPIRNHQPPAPREAAPASDSRRIPRRDTQASQSAASRAHRAHANLLQADTEPLQILLMTELFEGELLSLQTHPIDPVELQHRRLGHLGEEKMLLCVKSGTLNLTEREVRQFFKNGRPSCCLGMKTTRAPVGKRKVDSYIAVRPLQALWIDVMGPFSIIDVDKSMTKRSRDILGNLYLLVIVDEFTRAVFVFPMKTKSEANEHIMALIPYLQTRTGLKVERTRHDRAKDFMNHELETFLRKNGTYMAPTPAYSPALNGIVERMNRTLFDIARPLLLQANADTRLWGEAVKLAALILNTTPNSKLDGQTPFQRLYNFHFDLSKLRTFGCDVHVMNPPPMQKTIQEKTWIGTFLGFDIEQDLYKVLKYDIEKNRYEIRYEKDVEWNEGCFSNLHSLFKGKSTHLSHSYQTRQNMKYTAGRPAVVVIPPTVATKNPFAKLTEIDDEEDDEPPTVTRSRYREESDESDEETEANPNASEPEFFTSHEEAQRHLDSRQEEIPGIGDSDQDPEDYVEIADQADLREESAASSSQNSADHLKQVKPKKYRPTQYEVFVEESKRFADWNCNKRDRTQRRTIVRNPPTLRSKRGRQQESAEVNELQEVIDTFHQAPAFSSHPLEHILSVVNNLINDAQLGSDPVSHKDAMQRHDKDDWIEAEVSEHKSLKDFGVFVEVMLPPGKKAIRSKMLYKYKKGPLGEVLKRKCRIVAGGHLQVYGRDYEETFSPVLKMDSLRMLLALVIIQDLELKHIDYDTAYLNALVKEEIYVIPPETFRNGNKVWRLLKALYGLKQAGRNWNEELDSTMKQIGFHALIKDSCVYYKTSKNNKLIIMSLYVDDEMAAFHKDDAQEWEEIKASLASKYKIKDLGDLEWVLNMKVTRDRSKKTLNLSQEQYCKDLLSKFGMADCKPDILPYASEPIQMELPDGREGVPLSPEDHATYRSMIGGLLYLANLTRIDICFQVNRLAQFCHEPKAHHLIAAKKILRYIAGTKNLALAFKSRDRNELELDSYSDSDWATDTSTRKSVSGGLIVLSGNLVSWFSKKQPLTAQSSMEAEYIAMHETTKRTLWTQDWIEELYDTRPKCDLHCDNTSAIISAKDDKNHQRTRHIDIRYHLIRDHVKNGNITIKYIPTIDQPADFLTKPVTREIFERFRNQFLIAT